MNLDPPDAVPSPIGMKPEDYIKTLLQRIETQTETIREGKKRIVFLNGRLVNMAKGCLDVVGWLRLPPDRRTEAGATILASELSKLVKEYLPDADS